jgi:chromosome segregation ATPase
MANADTDRNDLQREIGARTARVERLRRRFVDTGPTLALIGANIAVILFVVVQLTGFDERLDGVEQRLTALEQRQTAVEDRLEGVDARLARIEEALATLLERGAPISAPRSRTCGSWRSTSTTPPGRTPSSPGSPATRTATYP